MSFFRKTPRNQQLMVLPHTWKDASPYSVPAINGTQLSVKEIERILARGSKLQEGEQATFTISTSFTNRNQETEFYSVTVDFEHNGQSITYKRKVI